MILVPIVLAFCGLCLAGGMTAMAHQSVQHAAEEAARTASLARTPSEAKSHGQAAARDSLAHATGVSCTSSTTAVDTLGFSTPAGTAATVTAHVTCDIDLGGIGFSQIAGGRHITADATSPIDTYRERS